MRVRSHPGDVLRHDFLVPLGLSATALAEQIEVPPNRITEIIRGRRDVTADTALRLGEFFDTTPEFWMNLQTAHNLSKARAERAMAAPAHRVLVRAGAAKVCKPAGAPSQSSALAASGLTKKSSKPRSLRKAATSER